jgi:hypothetical protein
LQIRGDIAIPARFIRVRRNYAASAADPLTAA